MFPGKKINDWKWTGRDPIKREWQTFIDSFNVYIKFAYKTVYVIQKVATYSLNFLNCYLKIKCWETSYLLFIIKKNTMLPSKNFVNTIKICIIIAWIGKI